MIGDILRGSTVTYSKVTLTQTHVRLVVDGVERDIALADGADKFSFEQAAGLARDVPVYLDAVWEKHADGSLHLDVMQTRVQRVDTTWGPPISGAEFVEEVQRLFPDGIDFDDWDDE